MNLKSELLNVDKYYSPRIIEEVNDQYIKVAKIEGSKVPWHKHVNRYLPTIFRHIVFMNIRHHLVHSQAC